MTEIAQERLAVTDAQGRQFEANKVAPRTIIWGSRRPERVLYEVKVDGELCAYIVLPNGPKQQWSLHALGNVHDYVCDEQTAREMYALWLGVSASALFDLVPEFRNDGKLPTQADIDAFIIRLEKRRRNREIEMAEKRHQDYVARGELLAKEKRKLTEALASWQRIRTLATKEFSTGSKEVDLLDEHIKGLTLKKIGLISEISRNEVGLRLAKENANQVRERLGEKV